MFLQRMSADVCLEQGGANCSTEHGQVLFIITVGYIPTLMCPSMDTL